MENVAPFYAWVVAAVERWVPRKAAIVDVGCGTGALLRHLAQRGYGHLTGVDIAPGCLDLAARRAPTARLALHDVEAAPLPERYDAALVTTVIDFVADPEAALANVHASLHPGGLLLLTIRNKLAFFPLYHLRGLARALAFSPRLAHWFLWFTTPLAMRRSDQPYERIYSSGAMRAMVERQGFTVVATSGSHIFPMLRPPFVPASARAFEAIDRLLWPFPAPPMAFSYMLICRTRCPPPGAG